jgi:hypothetical protein
MIYKRHYLYIQESSARFWDLYKTKVLYSVDDIITEKIWDVIAFRNFQTPYNQVKESIQLDLKSKLKSKLESNDISTIFK